MPQRAWVSWEIKTAAREVRPPPTSCPKHNVSHVPPGTLVTVFIGWTGVVFSFNVILWNDMRWISADAFGSEQIAFVFSHGENERFTAGKVQFSRIINFITGVPKHCGEKGILFNEWDLGHCWPQNTNFDSKSASGAASSNYFSFQFNSSVDSAVFFSWWIGWDGHPV